MVGIDLSFWLLTVNIYAFDGWRWYFKSFDGWLLKSTGTLLCSQMDYRFSSIKFSPSENRFLTFVSFSPYLPISSIVNNNKKNGVWWTPRCFWKSFFLYFSMKTKHLSDETSSIASCIWEIKWNNAINSIAKWDVNIWLWFIKAISYLVLLRSLGKIIAIKKIVSILI